MIIHHIKRREIAMLMELLGHGDSDAEIPNWLRRLEETAMDSPERDDLRTTRPNLLERDLKDQNEAE